MDNASSGGSRENFVSADVNFGVQNAAQGRQSFVETPKNTAQGSAEALASGPEYAAESDSTNTAETYQNLGGAATRGNTLNASNIIAFPGVDMETGMRETPELRPLAADGSTEKHMGKVAIKLSGDTVDEASMKQVREKVEELKKQPYQLSNYRDQAMADSLRDNFGRIFGDDDNGENDSNNIVAFGADRGGNQYNGVPFNNQENRGGRQAA